MKAAEKRRLRFDTETNRERAIKIMEIVGEVAGHRLEQILEHCYETEIKPLRDENQHLKSLLTQHGITF